MESEKHDLALFLDSVNAKLNYDYKTIQKRVKEDPGTAGDQAEETWAQILREWLPNHFHVVTKGRVIGSDGAASPQCDVVVLWPSYPKFLLDKKMYLASGVAAVFECKLTLRRQHLEKIFKNSVALSEISKGEYEDRLRRKKIKGENFFYEKYHRIFEFGVLAHSYEKEPSQAAVDELSKAIEEHDKLHVKDPVHMVDLFCVHNMGSWVSEKLGVTPTVIETEKNEFARIDYAPIATTNYHCLSVFSWGEGTGHRENFSALGSFISRFYRKLSRVDDTLGLISNYYIKALSTGAGGGGARRLWEYGPDNAEMLKLIQNRRGLDERVFYEDFIFLGF
ncbi:hypothetical protein SAMN05421759_10935 [Roseivivax lentus]|uniref:DUF6602 domain-containing protein n=1 Tax=Roseivivax lentus TaxID=633194 RepID=A0A1N7NMX2_9RHOB|nr:DUF6602 domain-containing protein [Roseivivax lentus]SIS99627.1 hypothetical protein SAMN05421759_10935 [Roseivivax lentus]